jgi:hypothetical protein
MGVPTSTVSLVFPKLWAGTSKRSPRTHLSTVPHSSITETSTLKATGAIVSGRLRAPNMLTIDASV